MPQYLSKETASVVLRLIACGRKPADISRIAKVSLPTVHRYIRMGDAARDPFADQAEPSSTLQQAMARYGLADQDEVEASMGSLPPSRYRR